MRAGGALAFGGGVAGVGDAGAVGFLGWSARTKLYNINN